MNKKHRVWLTEEQEILIIERYTAGESTYQIGKSLGVCANNVRNALLRHNVPLRDRSTARTRCGHRRDAFDVITPDAAYWAGFLFADGTVYQPSRGGSPIISIGLAACDRGHLEKFRMFLQSEHKIGERRTKNSKFGDHPQAWFAIRSAPLADALLRLGMRTKNLERIAPPALAQSRDFWRGFVDGDGYVSSPGGKVRIGICGSGQLIGQFIAFLQSNSVESSASIRSQSPIFRADWVCRTAISVIRLLYDDASTVLDRKNDNAQAILRRHRPVDPGKKKEDSDQVEHLTPKKKRPTPG